MKHSISACALSCLWLFACSSPEPGDASNVPSGGQPGSSGGTAGTGGGPSGGVSGGGAGGSASGGSAGTAAAGSSGAGGSAGSSGSGGSAGMDDSAGDTAPWRELNITAAPGDHRHDVGGRPVAVDNSAPIMMGKLIINLNVDDGGIYDFGLKRGFHIYGADIEHCDINYDTREHNGDCRLETFDGQDHSPAINVSYENSVMGKLSAALTELAATYPEEDWGYFLNQDGSVRWSDVGVTGVSHGAQSAARWARAYRLYRAVSRSGPRDTECGDGMLHAGTDFDPANPPYDVNCPDEQISAWIDEESATPTSRLFGFVGNEDGQYGDILFSMERMGYIGQPVNVSKVAPPFEGDSHRFYADDGHSGFDDEKYWPALGVAWGVPQANMDHAAGL
jgi:hypothetical protein